MKLGIGQSYDRVIVSKKIRAYFDLTKPASSIGIMLAIPFSAIFYGELYHTSGVSYLLNNWQTVIFAATTMFFLHGGAQAMNMSEDAEIDKKSDHKQDRPIPSGIVSVEEARSIAWILIMAGVARAFITSTSFGVFAVVLAILGIFYNLNPLRTKDILWVNVVTQALSRGLLLYPATFAVWGSPLDTSAWGLGAVAFLLVLSLQQSADLPDVKMDKEFGVITPAVYHGQKKLVGIMAAIIVMMFSMYSVLLAIGVIDVYSIYLLSVLIVPSLVYMWYKPDGISSVSGQSPVWFVFYACLGLMYLLPALEYIVLK